MTESDLDEISKYNGLSHKVWGLQVKAKIFAWQEYRKLKRRIISIQ